MIGIEARPRKLKSFTNDDVKCDGNSSTNRNELQLVANNPAYT
jgi:hypothetical protein